MGKIKKKKNQKNLEKINTSFETKNNFDKPEEVGKSEEAEESVKKSFTENDSFEKEISYSKRKFENETSDKIFDGEKNELSESEFSEISEYQCKECGKKINVLSLPKHMKKLHNKSISHIQCKCGKYISASSYYRHKITHKRKNQKKNKSFYIYKNTIISNLTKDEIIEELEESIKRANEWKNKILMGKFQMNVKPLGQPLFKFNHQIC